MIRADSMNGQPLGSGHFRLVIPEDRKGARDVRDVRDVVRVSIFGPQ